MPFANHFLGAIARLNATLWWHRVSGVPLRVVLVFYLAVWGAELWKSALGRATMPNRRWKYRWSGVETVRRSQNYARMSGLLAPAALYNCGFRSKWGTDSI